MTNNVIDEYITERYDRWLDYAKYHCSRASMDDEAVDVLNEVLAMLLEKCKRNKSYIIQLYESKKGQYRELDFFVLQMIKLNIQSPTSPYRHRYKSLPTDGNSDVMTIDIIDDEDSEVDRAGYIIERMHIVRGIFESLELSEQAKVIFSFKFFEGNRFSEWEGKEDRKQLYDIYNGVLKLIKDKLNNRGLF